MVRSKSPMRGADSAAAAQTNPIKFDPELKDMVSNVKNIKTWKRFQGWKKSFLERLETFVKKTGMDKAESAYENDFKNIMKTTTKCLDKCSTMIEKGDLTNEKVSVKGRNSLNELCKTLMVCYKETDELIPSSGRDEKKRGYTKFQLGVVLVRDQFSEYDNMKKLNDYIEIMRTEKLSEVADRQQLDAMVQYQTEFKKFCDIMADLGLFDVMMASRKFANEPDEPEPDMIEITIKTIDGKKITLELDSAETVDNVKKTIADACGIVPTKQILKFKNKELKDGSKSLDDCGIQDKSILTVEPPQFPITVNTMDGKKIQIMVDPDKPLEDIKKQIAKETNVPVDNMNLFKDDSLLDDDDDPFKPASDYGIKMGIELDMEPKTIKLNIETPDGETIPITVSPRDTDSDIKSKIEDQTGIAAPRQVVTIPSQNNKTLPSGKVKDMKLNNNDVLKMEIYKIPVKLSTTIMIEPSAKMSDIKKMILSELQKDMKLVLNGEELKESNKRGTDYGFKDNITLEMIRK